MLSFDSWKFHNIFARNDTSFRLRLPGRWEKFARSVKDRCLFSLHLELNQESLSRIRYAFPFSTVSSATSPPSDKPISSSRRFIYTNFFYSVLGKLISYFQRSEAIINLLTIRLLLLFHFLKPLKQSKIGRK